MKFHNPSASFYVPDNMPEPEALSRVTHLGVGAHHDDLEFMAFHGILQCYQRSDQWFGGITCTDGAGSARTGPYINYTDDQMKVVRREEQEHAARVGQYSFVAQLAYPSSAVKQTQGGGLTGDLGALLSATTADVVYTHNPADKHETHLGVLVSVLEAIRALPPDRRPARLLGCEVWRDLDWMPDDAKVVLDVSGADALAEKLNNVFASQIAGGKRYDLAVEGRRRANATFLASHATDAIEKVWLAMDLTPLAQDASPDVVDFTTDFIDRFREDVRVKLLKRIKG